MTLTCLHTLISQMLIDECSRPTGSLGTPPATTIQRDLLLQQVGPRTIVVFCSIFSHPTDRVHRHVSLLRPTPSPSPRLPQIQQPRQAPPFYARHLPSRAHAQSPPPSTAPHSTPSYNEQLDDTDREMSFSHITGSGRDPTKCPTRGAQLTSERNQKAKPWTHQRPRAKCHETWFSKQGEGRGTRRERGNSIIRGDSSRVEWWSNQYQPNTGTTRLANRTIRPLSKANRTQISGTQTVNSGPSYACFHFNGKYAQ